MLIKPTSLQAITAASDQTDKEGCFTDASGVVMASATAVPHGLIVDGGPSGGTTTIATCAGGAPGSFNVKLHSSPGTVNKGTRLVLHSNGTTKADPGTGSRVVVAEAQESGAANELIEAVLISPPIVLS